MHNSFEVAISVVARVVGVLVVVLVLAHFALAHRDWPGFRLFHLDAEGSLGTSFASILGLASGTLALGAAGLARRAGMAHRALAALGIGLVLYGIDEVAQVHEGLSAIVGEMVRGSDDGMAGTSTIGYVLLPIFITVIWALWRVTERGVRLLITSGLALFWIAGFGIEELEHMNYEGRLPFTRGLSMEQGDFILVGIQETLEMVAISTVLIGVLKLLARRRHVVALEVTE